MRDFDVDFIEKNISNIVEININKKEKKPILSSVKKMINPVSQNS